MGVRAMYEMTLEYIIVPRGCYPSVNISHSLFPSSFSPLFHSSCPGRTTHRHLAIHLGPVLLITRLELRTRTGTAGARETSRTFEKKMGGPTAPRVARSRDHRSLLVLVDEIRLSFVLLLSYQP